MAKRVVRTSFEVWFDETVSTEEFEFFKEKLVCCVNDILFFIDPDLHVTATCSFYHHDDGHFRSEAESLICSLDIHYLFPGMSNMVSVGTLLKALADYYRILSAVRDVRVKLFS